MSILLGQEKARKPAAPKTERPRKTKEKTAKYIFEYEVTSCHFTIGSTIYRRGTIIKLTKPEAKEGLEAGSLRRIE